MPRRQQRSPSSEPALAQIPWWVFVLLAVISFAVLHWMSLPPAPTDVAQTHARNIMAIVVRTFATIGKFILPAALLVLALMAAFARFRRDKVRAAALVVEPQMGDVPAAEVVMDPDRYPEWKAAGRIEKPTPTVATNAWSLELIRVLEWKRFELLCASYFEALGFRTEVAQKGADGGIDIRLYPGSAQVVGVLVQCKAWNVYPVGVKEVRELYGVMAAGQVKEGCLVTSGTFSAEAREFAYGKDIQLIDGADLLAKLTALPDATRDGLLEYATQGDYLTPTCASCGVKMVRRETREDGKAFWGCVNFPRCRTRMKS